ncbi:MAG: hypothetical protein H7145_16130 [Akkermansiaceae bacterium]|nr:hypothetical protein [Armatimonadota bacterium]
MDNEQLVLVESVGEATEAEILCGVLRAEGLTVVSRERNQNGVALGLHSILLNSMYDLYVYATDAAKARALVETYNNSRGEFSEEELADAAVAAYDERV